MRRQLRTIVDANKYDGLFLFVAKTVATNHIKPSIGLSNTLLRISK